VDPEWIELPRAGAENGFYDKIIAIFITILDPLSRGDKTRATITSDQKLCLLLRCALDCLRMNEQLTAWYYDFEGTLSGPFYWAVLSTSDNATDTSELKRPFPVAFRSPAYADAQPLLWYWIGTLVVHSTLCDTYGELQALANIEGFTQVDCTCANNENEKKQNEPSLLCPRRFSLDTLLPRAIELTGPLQDVISADLPSIFGRRTCTAITVC